MRLVWARLVVEREEEVIYILLGIPGKNKNNLIFHVRSPKLRFDAEYNIVLICCFNNARWNRKQD